MRLLGSSQSLLGVSDGQPHGGNDGKAVTNASDTTKHPVGALVVARGEEQSKGHRGEANCGDIQEGPLTPKAVAGGIARGLATSPRLVTTLRSKGKGKGKVQEEDDEDIEEQIEETFSDKCLVALLCWQKALMVVDTGLGARAEEGKEEGDSVTREVTRI
ncbi:hypothetical protein C0989_001878 [Termitomyces sp. Mn162]|nr:hypothetical protein C0989_001878 [Termitomyces sp. Mn162]